MCLGMRMKRNLNELESGTFDLCIIGGGVIGACIARDAARRGMKVALVEMNDFACAASEAMSHTIHGGIRYLAQGRIGLVREALSEKAVWMATAPDFIFEQKFIMPLGGGLNALKMKAGIALYQRLGGRRAAFLSDGETVEREPCLARPGLSGAAVYHDARVDEPHRLILSILQDAGAHGAVAANHVECAALLSKDGKAAGIGVIDRLSGSAFEIRASHVVNATGPWAQRIASLLAPGQKQAWLTASKGIHILTPPVSRDFAIAVSGKGEHGFILPWKGMSLVGTTDALYSGDTAEAQPNEQEIAALVEKMARLLPQSRGLLNNRIGSFAGVRALPGAAGDTYRASREVAVCDHAMDGASGLFSLFGGKWTTARLIAERFLDRLAAGFTKTLKTCDTRHVKIRRRSAPSDLAARLCMAADGDMAVTEEDFHRRIGRADLLTAPDIDQQIKAWLASRDNTSDSVAGR
jgi:glycerol-3-phosphate dehydrogenase